MLRGQSNTAAIIAIGVSTVILLILSSVLVITTAVLIRNYRRRSAKQELNTDILYSTLNRGSEQQVQSQYMQQNSNDTTIKYTLVHLLVKQSLSQNLKVKKNNSFYNSHPTNSDTENSVTSASAELQVNSPLATYVAVDNRKTESQGLSMCACATRIVATATI